MKKYLALILVLLCLLPVSAFAKDLDEIQNYGVSVQLSELYVPKLIDISATQMRAHLIEGNLEAWKKYTCPALWEDYEALRQAVIAAKDNLETASM